MQRCWAADPAERPGFAEVVRQLRYVRSRCRRRLPAVLCGPEHGMSVHVHEPCFAADGAVSHCVDGLICAHAALCRALLSSAAQAGAAIGSSRTAAAGGGA